MGRSKFFLIKFIGKCRIMRLKIEISCVYLMCCQKGTTKIDDTYNFQVNVRNYIIITIIPCYIYIIHFNSIIIKI